MRLPTTISSSTAGSTPGSEADGICADASRRPARSATATRTPRQANRRLAPRQSPVRRTMNFLIIGFPLNAQISNRRQNRERLTSASQPQFIHVCNFHRNLINPRRGRSIPAGSNHICYSVLSPLEHGLDAAVAPVPHPTLQAKPPRLMVDPGPVAHALHPSADHDPTEGSLHRLTPRNAARRAFTSTSRVTWAVKPAGARPVKAFGGSPSRNALSVS